MGTPVSRDIFKQSILNIKISLRNGPQGKQAWQGTGSVVRADKKRTLILTAAHVILPQEIVLERIRSRLPLYSTDDLRITAYSSDGKGFETKCLPIRQYLTDVVFLETETEAVGEMLPAFEIAGGSDPSQTHFSVFGFADIMEGIKILGLDKPIRPSHNELFFYLSGNVFPGFSGAPVFETGKTEIFGIVTGYFNQFRAAIYGPNYETITTRLQSLQSDANEV